MAEGGAVEIELIRATAAVRRTGGQADRRSGGRECGGQAVGKAETDRILSLIARGPDWGKTIELAEFHGTVPLLQQCLAQLPEGSVPPAVLQALADRSRAIAARNLLLTRRLTEAWAALEQAGIRVLALKGPTLAMLGYGDLSLRQFNDIDLLVAPADRERALGTLRDMGYEFAYRLTPRQQDQYVRAMGQVPMRDAQGTLVELHTTLTDTAYHFPLEFDALWSRRQPVVLLDHPVSTPGDEDLLLYLAVHGTKHAWSCLGWVVDLVRLMATTGNVDWVRLLERATALRCRRILLLSLELARKALGGELPAAVSEASRADRVALRLAEERSRRLLGRADPEYGFRAARFHLRSRERLRDGVAFVRATIFSAHLSDWQAIDLPAGWEFLYPVLRPLRLVRKYASLVTAHGGP